MAALSESNASAILAAVELPRATFYRLKSPALEPQSKANRKRPARALSVEERERVAQVLYEERFVDKAPATVYAALLDEGIYLCSISTMYRILRERDEVRERRKQLRHPNYKKPELLATGPNQVWSWDITKLKGPQKWRSYHLYVILDIFSRYVVGWMISTRESGELAKELIDETCTRQSVQKENLLLHSDRGPAMTSKSVALLLSELGVVKSLSRPHVSNDNPYSESQFKTMKYQPMFPERFGSIQDARAFCVDFFKWYNEEHYHSGLALMTPASVHFGKASARNQQRQKVLNTAYLEHPERFVKSAPKVLELPTEAWINRPKDEEDAFVATTGNGTVFGPNRK